MPYRPAPTGPAEPGGSRPGPGSIVAMLDEQRRTVLRITPDKVLVHE